ncbi:MAG: hypothetical protein AAB693_00755 [Patescibacteria group bacterium]
MKNIIKQLFFSVRDAQKTISSLNIAEKQALEKGWDIEHAYYSSALEGSKLDRKEFEKLAEVIA